ncbi:MAG: hypothetical protein MUP82_07115 [Candidatus Marinimicrobia bacterium]|nr:hypothetical protein [Candidatus Neomarinimicrobiota bacterium]
MNQNQKYVLIGMSVILLLQLIFLTPIKCSNAGITVFGHASIFQSNVICSINLPQFILYWFILLVFGGIAFYMAKDNKKE